MTTKTQPNMKMIPFAAVLLILTFLQSCASLTGFEEARTVGKDNSMIVSSINIISLPDDLTQNEIDIFPNMDVNFRYGILDDVDIGVRVTTNFNLGAFIKAQLHESEDKKFAMGAGFEVASTWGLFTNIQVPLFLSFYPSEHIIYNISPRLAYQFATFDIGTGITYAGLNTGFLVGKQFKYGVDLGYYNVRGLSSGNHMISFGIGGKLSLSR